MDLRERVYRNLRAVPRGKVVTYKELAKSVGSRASRVVGGYMKTNPDPVKTPCYKVVLSSGKVGRYSSVGGSKEKIRKLEKDGVVVKDGKVDLERYGYSFV